MGLEKRYILLSAIRILFVWMRQEVKELQVKKQTITEVEQMEVIKDLKLLL